ISGVRCIEQIEASADMRTILLESLTFDQDSIRLTSRSLRMRTEASARFDKGLSPELPPYGLRRAVQLMVQLAGGQSARGILDVYPGRRERAPLPFSTADVARILGVDWPIDLIRGRLEALGFAWTPPRRRRRCASSTRCRPSRRSCAPRCVRACSTPSPAMRVTA